jgi:hypothetical protein
VTGPEHYKRAEKLITGLGEIRETLQSGNASVAEVAAGAAIINGLIAEAQVHATLAIAASGLRSLLALEEVGS